MVVMPAPVLDREVERILFPPEESRGAAARMLGAALDLLYPPHCACCNRPLAAGANKALCRGCAERIRWIGSDRCRRCGDGVGAGSGVVSECPSCRTHPPAFVHSACALAHYFDGPVRDLVLGLKFGAKLHAAEMLGRLLAQRVVRTELLPLPEAGPTLPTIVVPAPLSRHGLARRGFNQAAELAACLARQLKLPLETRLLLKIRSTPPQATLSHEKRRTNLAGAFACNPRIARRCQGRAVLLIDDVITTGSTISECARTLVAAGIGEVRAAAVARG